LFIGLGVAIIGVVPPSYALWSENPTWGQDLVLDMFSLFAAVAVGVFGSAAVGDALSPVKAPADPGAPPPAGGNAAAGGTTVAAGSTMAGGPSAAGATTAPGGRSAAGSGDDGEGARR
jgi:hypothetical protein